jgi:hypothetical protein
MCLVTIATLVCCTLLVREVFAFRLKLENRAMVAGLTNSPAKYKKMVEKLDNPERPEPPAPSHNYDVVADVAPPPSNDDINSFRPDTMSMDGTRIIGADGMPRKVAPHYTETAPPGLE